MRIAVLGTGAMGMLFAAMLKKEHDVVLLGRNREKIEAFTSQGVTVEEPDGRMHTAYPTAAEMGTPMEPVDLMDRLCQGDGARARRSQSAQICWGSIRFCSACKTARGMKRSSPALRRWSACSWAPRSIMLRFAELLLSFMEAEGARFSAPRQAGLERRRPPPARWRHRAFRQRRAPMCALHLAEAADQRVPERSDRRLEGADGVCCAKPVRLGSVRDAHP